ncbi:hypothetical protein Tco_0350430 [Tanacetum coccineum]
MARLNPTNRIGYVRGSLPVAPVVTNGNVLGGQQTPHVAYPNGSNGILGPAPSDGPPYAFGPTGTLCMDRMWIKQQLFRKLSML